MNEKASEVNRFFMPFYRLYRAVLRAGEHPSAIWILSLVTFTESFIFPIPQDVMMIPMMMASKRKAFLIATVALLTSIAGGIAGYFIGFYLFDFLGQAIITFYGQAENYERFVELYRDNGPLIVFIGGLTPFPYKIVTLSSGFVQMALFPFIAYSILGRAIRFYFLATIFWFWGDAMHNFIEKYFSILTSLVGGVIIVAFLSLKIL